MPKTIGTRLSPREREILDILNRLREATVSEILAGISDPPSYSAVRATLRVMVAKGLVRDRSDGRRYLYMPSQSRDEASTSALGQLLETFFGGKVKGLVKTLLTSNDLALTSEELDELADLIQETRNRSR